jgi:hypothetical protein
MGFEKIWDLMFQEHIPKSKPMIKKTDNDNAKDDKLEDVKLEDDKLEE